MISVCMATHNGERYIKGQLDSILCQLSSDDEIVISDDGSTDHTLDVIGAYDDPRIKIYHYKQPSISKHPHIYVTRNFGNALKNCRGDYIFLSDQDDKWMPEKVEMCMAALAESDLVVHNIRFADENLHDLGYCRYKGKFRFHNYFLQKGAYYGCTMAFKKSVLQYVLPFPNKLILHDYWIGILGETFGSAIYIDTPLILYRLRDDSASHKTSNSLLYKINYRFYILLHLYIRIIKWKILIIHKL